MDQLLIIMKRFLIAFILCLIGIVGKAQYNGMDSVSIGSWHIKTLIYPRAADWVPGKKYAVIIHYNGDSTIGTNLSLEFKTGFPRQVKNGKVQGTIADSIIHICPQATVASGLRTPDAINQILDYVLANIPFDSTKINGNMYKYLCIGGLSQGALDAFDNLTWSLSGYGTIKYVKRVYHAYFLSTPNSFPSSGALDSLAKTNTMFLHEFNANSCCLAWPAQNISAALSARGDGTISSFTTESFVGNGYNNITWDSMLSPLGNDSLNNIYLWVLGRGLPQPISNIIPVYQTSMYDLSGRLLHKDRPWNYFDANGSVDPKHGKLSFTAQMIPDEKGNVRLIKADTTTATPYSGRDASYWYADPGGSLAFAGYWFPGKRGRCIIVDLQNEKNIKKAFITHGKKFDINYIYGYEKEFEAGDSLYFYNFDKVIEEVDVQKRAWMIARPDSMLTPMGVLVSQGGTGSAGAWRNITISDSCRYVMIRNTLQQRSGYTSTAEFSELVFYGAPRGDTAVPWSGYTGPVPAQKPIRDKAGVNTGVQITHANLDIVKYTRLYENADYWDDDTTRANRGKQLFNANKFPGYKTWYQDFNNNNRNLWLAIFGAAKFCGVDAGGQSVRNNIDSFKTEPGVPMHYKNQGRMFWQIGVKFGNGTDTRYRFYNDTEFPGIHLNWFKFIEFGNEDDTYQPPVVCAARMTMSIDGNNGMFGDSLGIKNGDPNMKRVYTGLTYPDSFRIRTVMFLMEIMRNDTSSRLFDVISFHDYSRSIDTVTNIKGPTYDEQLGNKGMLGERNNWWYHTDCMARFVWNITGGDTAIKTWNTEYGWDNYSTAPTTTGQLASLWTTTGTPIISGYDSVQSKAISIMRLEMIMASTTLDQYTEFNAHNGSLDQTNNVFQNFYTCGWGGGNYDLSTKFPNFYMKKWMYGRFGDYYVDQIVSKDSVGLWVIKFRKQGATDSVMYAIWKGSETGSNTAASFSINPVNGNTFQKEIYSFSTKASTVTSLGGSGASVSLTAYEMPTLLFAKESPIIPVQGYRFRKGKIRLIIH